jgi:proteasome lid subunit RPN8/RPN11
MALQLSSDQLKAMQTHAERTYPEECCGLLLGQSDRPSDLKTLVEVRPTENTWSAAVAAAFNLTADSLTADSTTDAPFENSFTKTRRYWIDPQEMLAGQQYARDRQLDIIGIYHSHPDYPAVPSECDRACAWSQYSYMIVSVQQGIAQDLLCWSLDDQHQFQPEAQILVASPQS